MIEKYEVDYLDITQTWLIELLYQSGQWLIIVWRKCMYTDKGNEVDT